MKDNESSWFILCDLTKEINLSLHLRYGCYLNRNMGKTEKLPSKGITFVRQALVRGHIGKYSS